MAEDEFSQSNAGNALMADPNRVEQSIETEDKDIFDDVFEEDEDERAAKVKMAQKAGELKKKIASKTGDNKSAFEAEENGSGGEESTSKEVNSGSDSGVNKNNTSNSNASNSKASTKSNSGSDKDDEDGDGGEDEADDEDEELEEDEEDSTEPTIFGEVGKEENHKNKDKDGSDDSFETKDEAFEAVDAGGKKKKTSFDDLIKEKLDKSLKNADEKKSKGYGGKLDLRVVHEEDEEEDNSKPHPVERNIIKTVIKNKAMMAAKEDINLNKGVKIKDDSYNEKDDGDSHDEMAEELMREDGIREEGISTDNFSEEDEENEVKSKMPKANIPVEEEQEGEDSGSVKPELEFLMSKEGHAFIGRKKSVLGKYGEEGGLFVGRVHEKDKAETDVYLDGLNPHVVFVCGARGSGKSYVLGVIAEELAVKNKNVGIVVVDPIGVFWSMKHPNKEEKELEALAKWDLMPSGLDNIKVFIPVGMKDSVPKSTYDAVFSIQPALLTAEDWCLTFGIDRFSPTGLLMEKGIAKVKSGYETEGGKEIRGKQNTFSLEDLIKCFEQDTELNDKDKGYKADSIRALVSRFDAAKHWGIFDEKGTSLGLLSRAGQMTILDTSFLEDNVSALVIGIISRRLLAARKLGTRREAAGKFTEGENIDDLVELNIPPTWLFIDEAHTLIPGGNQKTPASSALVEYVKQGRRPGCSLVFATQQPSAIDSRVLSQLDIIMAHKLVFDDDIKSIYKRTPTIVPGAYKRGSFIKTMPVGIALTGDRSETTSRAFVMSIRPRMSQHEGRDAETVEVKQELEENQVKVLATNIVLRQLKKDPRISLDSLAETLDTLNNTYKKKLPMEEIIDALKAKGIIAKENYLYAPGVLEEMAQEEEEEKEKEAELSGEEAAAHAGKKKLSKEIEQFEEQLQDIEEKVELTALHSAIDEQKARKIIAGFISKKFIFLDQEVLDRITLKHAPIYKIRYKYFSHKDAFHVGEAYIDSLTGEFIHDDRGSLKESKGLPILNQLSEAESNILKLVAEKKRTSKDTAGLMRMEEGNAKRILDALVKKGFLSIEENDKGKVHYEAKGKIEMDLPPSPLHDILPSIGKRPITEINSAAVLQPRLNEKEIPELLRKLWGNIVVKEITQIFLPVWEGTLKKKTGEERTLIIDAINGRQINLI